jgi:hypothetical protein
MVAAAGAVGDLTPAAAWACVLAALGTLVLCAYLADGPRSSAASPKPPRRS